MATFTLQLNGALTPSGHLIPQNVLTPTGALFISTGIFQAGSIQPTGALAIAQLVSPTGTITPTGALITSPTKVLAGSLAPTGALSFSLQSFFSSSLAPAGGLFIGIGEAPCGSILAELQDVVAKMLDDPDFVYYTRQEVRHALNQSERLFAFITLCYEKSVSFALTNGQAFYQISDQIADFIAPLKVSYNGARLRSDTIHQLNLRDSAWRSRAGSPTRYIQTGFDVFAITPQPASGVNTLSLTYAAEPPGMVASSDSPVIPADQQIHLPDGAYFFCRYKEGGAELQMATKYLQRFIEAAQKYQSFTRAKGRAQGYDREPVDLSTFDRSHLEVKLKRQMAERKKQEGSNG